MMNQLNHIQLFPSHVLDHSRDPYFYGLTSTNFGPALLISRAGYLLGLGFTEHLTELVNSKWPHAEWQQNNDLAFIFWQKIIKNDEIKIVVFGTPFQQAVWKSLLSVASGATTTYKDLATNIGYPNAHRAVGSAVGANPISYLIPCHRVIRSDGTAGGYRWGVDLKNALLKKENFL